MSERRGGVFGQAVYILGKGRVGRETRVHLAIYLGFNVAQLQGLITLVRSYQLGDNEIAKYLFFHPHHSVTGEIMILFALL